MFMIKIHFWRWGERLDDIRVHDAWYKMHGYAAKEGIISIGYNNKIRNKIGEYARVYQYCKLYLVKKKKNCNMLFY